MRPPENIRIIAIEQYGADPRRGSLHLADIEPTLVCPPRRDCLRRGNRSTPTGPAGTCRMSTTCTVRLPDVDGKKDRLYFLMLAGVRPNGRTELVVFGRRTSGVDPLVGRPAAQPPRPRTQSARVSDRQGLLGFCSALRDVFGDQVRQGRCSVQRITIPDTFPRRIRPDAETVIHRIRLPKPRSDAVDAVGDSVRTFENPTKTTSKITTGELNTLLMFFDDLAWRHWMHLISTNVIESAYATVRLRTKVIKRVRTGQAAPVMAYRLCDAAQDRLRLIDAPPAGRFRRARAACIGQKPTRKAPNGPIPVPKMSARDHDPIPESFANTSPNQATWAGSVLQLLTKD